MPDSKLAALADAFDESAAIDMTTQQVSAIAAALRFVEESCKGDCWKEHGEDCPPCPPCRAREIEEMLGHD